jgi:hypothetical protein
VRRVLQGSELRLPFAKWRSTIRFTLSGHGKDQKGKTHIIWMGPLQRGKEQANEARSRSTQHRTRSMAAESAVGDPVDQPQGMGHLEHWGNMGDEKKDVLGQESGLGGRRSLRQTAVISMDRQQNSIGSLSLCRPKYQGVTAALFKGTRPKNRPTNAADGWAWQQMPLYSVLPLSSHPMNVKLSPRQTPPSHKTLMQWSTFLAS